MNEIQIDRLIDNVQYDDIIDPNNNVLKWRDVWRPADKVLPNSNKMDLTYLALTKQYYTDVPRRSASIVHFDGKRFWVALDGKRLYPEIEYWMPFPQFLDAPLHGDSLYKPNLQFPMAVLFKTTAEAFCRLKLQNKVLMHLLNKKNYIIDKLNEKYGNITEQLDAE